MTATHVPTDRLPAPGVWTIDPGHSSVSFSARHLMVSRVRGRFALTGGHVTIAADPLESSVEAIVDAASVESGDARRDEHLRSADFFDAEQFPTLSFRSTGLRQTGGAEYELQGDLTVRDVTRPVVFEVEYLGTAQDPWGGTRAGFAATTEVNRKDWGLEWNVALETGGWLVSDKVRLTIDAEVVREQAQ